jgi:hypothetical protein
VAVPGQQIVTLPSLSIGRHDMRDFSKTPRLIAAGREAGRAMVAEERRAKPSTAQTAVPAQAHADSPALAT